MIQDRENRFSEEQAVTVTAVSTDSFDTQAGLGTGPFASMNRNIGDDKDLRLSVRISESFATATSVNFEYVQADDAALTSNLEVLTQSGAIAIASLTIGKRVKFGTIPKNTKRYVGMRYTVAGANATAGRVNAALVSDEQTNDVND